MHHLVKLIGWKARISSTHFLSWNAQYSAGLVVVWLDVLWDPDISAPSWLRQSIPPQQHARTQRRLTYRSRDLIVSTRVGHRICFRHGKSPSYFTSFKMPVGKYWVRGKKCVKLTVCLSTISSDFLYAGRSTLSYGLIGLQRQSVP